MQNRLPHAPRQARHALKPPGGLNTRSRRQATPADQAGHRHHPEHAAGVGRHRCSSKVKPRARLGVAGAAAVAVLAVAVAVGIGPHSVPESTAGPQRVVVELQAPPDQMLAIAAARTTCDSLNPGLRLGSGNSTARAAAADALVTLQDALNEVTAATETVFVLEGVPEPVVKSYEDREISLRKLFASAEEVKTTSKQSIENEVAEESEGLVAVPKVMAPLKTPATQLLDEAAKQLDEAVAKLPVADRVSVLGADAIDPTALTDEELDEAIAADPAPSFEIEKERRFAAALPDLSEAENGRIDESLLCPIPWAPDYRLLCVSVDKLEQLNERFKANFGHDLPVQSAYRSYEEQVAAHEAAPYMTTLPGSSNHSWGLALDFDIDAYDTYDHPEVVWLVENAPAYGWRNPTLESFGTAAAEPWHFEFATTYPDSADGGFHGPTPEVEYQIRLPDGARPQTLLSTP